MWGKLKKICIKKSNDSEGQDRIALLIDGPNMLRKEFNVDLDKIREVLSKFGKIVIGRVYLNQYASDKLIEAIANQGFEPRVTAGDVDVEMAVEGTELIFNKNIDTIAYMTRDADFLPAMRKAKEHVIGAEPGFSLAIQNIADHVIKIEDDFTFDKEKLAKKKEKRVEEGKENVEEIEESPKEESKKEGPRESLINKINWFKN